ncbi:hypothetical protein AAV35_002850 [Salimicrobium jeotgali]|uniref:Uncharacterized protein n=2 Tax=Salimicrobium jeotgali TaxID=1230341 RepID=K2FPP5_9BACI|nr:hypothetical protein AAV35_002850 [Salimicrobium jeotgali]EKE32846.1 hypothetical protein MJ3_00060 [Salimicrobium jeotgali]
MLMTELLLSHIPSTLLHILTGLLVADLLFKGPDFHNRKARFVLLGGVGVIVLMPDLPKLFGVLIGHSLVTVPIIAAFFAIFTRALLTMSFFSIWWRLTLVLVVSALGIDYLGNGVHLLYPITGATYGLSLIRYEFFYILPVSLLLFVQLRKGTSAHHRNN